MYGRCISEYWVEGWLIISTTGSSTGDLTLQPHSYLIVVLGRLQNPRHQLRSTDFTGQQPVQPFFDPSQTTF